MFSDADLRGSNETNRVFEETALVEETTPAPAILEQEVEVDARMVAIELKEFYLVQALYALEHHNNGVDYEHKPDGSIVTPIDKEIEERARALAAVITPGAAFLGEERMDEITPEELFQAEYVWIMDPIDGTSNFTFGRPNWGSEIGLFKNNDGVLEPVVSAATAPVDGIAIISGPDGIIEINLSETPPTEKPMERMPVSDGIVLYSDYDKITKEAVEASKECLDFRSSLIHGLDIVRGAGDVLIGRPSVWDLGPIIGLAQEAGLKVYNLENGEEISGITLDMLQGDGPNPWKLKHGFAIGVAEKAEVILDTLI